MSACRSCGAEIIWALTEGGKRMPLDAEPEPRTGLFVFEDGYAKEPPPVHKIHFATCPQAQEWRR